MSENEYKFQKLTPTDDVDLALYENALDFVFDSSDIKNVAISGAYGAGKSSVLASYKNKHTDYRFIHISLAHFEQPTQEQNQLVTGDNKTDSKDDSYSDHRHPITDTFGSANEVKESVLEGKILNQLIHQIPAKKIPQTNFKVKKKNGTLKIISTVILFMLFIVSLLCYLTSRKLITLSKT